MACGASKGRFRARHTDHRGMNTTLVATLIGVVGTVVGTIGGVLITQLLSDRREKAAWERESERERARWAREDAARTFEERRDAYISFYYANEEAGHRVHAYLMARLHGRDDAEPPSAWVPDAEEKLNALAIYGSQRVLDLAHEAQTQYRKMASEAEEWKTEDGTEPLDRRGDEWYFSRRDMLQAMRDDLGIPKDASVGTLSPRPLPHLARFAP